MGIEQFFLSYANSMIFHSIHVLGIVWVFPNNFYSGFPQRNSIVWELSHSQSLVIAWVPINSKSVRQSRTQKLSVFSHTCFLIWEFTHPVVWICMDFCFTSSIQEPIILKCLFFPKFFLSYGNSLSPCFGNCMDSHTDSQLYEFHIFSMNQEKVPNFLQKPTTWERYGFPQNVFM